MYSATDKLRMSQSNNLILPVHFSWIAGIAISKSPIVLNLVVLLLKVNENIKHLHRFHYYLRVLICYPAPLHEWEPNIRSQDESSARPLSCSLSLYSPITCSFRALLCYRCIYLHWGGVQRRERECSLFKRGICCRVR